MSIKLTVLTDQALALLDSLQSEPDPLQRLRNIRDVEEMLKPRLARLRDEAAYRSRESLSADDIGDYTGYGARHVSVMAARHAELTGLPSVLYQRRIVDLAGYLDLTGALTRPSRASSIRPTA